MRRTLIAALLVSLTLAGAAWAGGGRNRVIGNDMVIAPLRSPVKVDGDLQEWDESRAILLSTFSGSAGESKQAFEDYSAQVALAYDPEALYVAAWFKDPTPLGAQTNAGCLPPGDGLILHLPLQKMARLALWRVPGKTEAKAVVALGDQTLAQGKPAAGVTQGFKVTGKDTYVQEARIPWTALAATPRGGQALRLGLELCFGGLDPAAGYRAWAQESAVNAGVSGNRFGGAMGWGFMDGLASLDQLRPTYDPATGALVTLAPAGAVAPPSQPMLYMGDELTRTTRMIAVPAGKITVDGAFKPGEWDPRSATRIASEPTLFPARYATDVHWAYAPEGLYVGLRWHTAGPHLNVNAPEVLHRGYDGGDSLQIRLGTDKVTHIDAWYYDQRKQAAMGLVYGARFDGGEVPDALGQGAKLAIAPVTGGGYTQELFLPWKLITATGAALQEGQTFRVVLDLFYAGLEGNRIPYIVNAKLAQPTGVVTLPFTAPREGYYTLLVENEQGQLVRRLLAHMKVRAGQVVADWDGLDEQGRPVPPGTYRFRGLHHTGVGMKYLMSLNNPGHPAWQTDDGKGEWGGDHGPPQAVAADEQGLYLGWPSAEDGCGIIGCDFAGRKQWGYFGTPFSAAGGGTALLATDGKYLYFGNEAMRPTQQGEKELAYFQSVISCLDRSTGQRRGFSVGQAFHRIAETNTSQNHPGWLWDLWPNKSYTLDSVGLRNDYTFSGRCAGANLVGLAVGGGKLYAALRLSGEAVAFSSEDMKELARWKLPQPGGLALSAEGRLFAISGRTVVALDTASGQATPVVSAGLEAPVGIALDKAGNLYVSEWGATQCVRVFSPQGKLLRSIGTPGGRPWLGRYDPNGMLMPRGLAVDKQNRLWVAEDDNYPRRVSVWNAADGKFLQEFIGGAPYGGVAGGVLDPADPTRAFSLGVQFSLDLSQEGYRPVSTLWREVGRDSVPFGLTLGTNCAPHTRLFRVGGRCFTSSMASAAQPVVLGELRADGSWRALAALGGVHPRAEFDDSKLRWWERPVPTPHRGHAGENFLWQDQNGDSVMQPEEFQWQKSTPELPGIGLYWGTGVVRPDLNFFVGGSGVAMRLAPTAVSDEGYPRFDLAKLTPVGKFYEQSQSLTADPEGSIYTVYNGEWRTPTKDPNLECLGPDGKLRWAYPTHADCRPMGRINGEIVIGPVEMGGEIGRLVSLSQWHGLYLPLLTGDGLFIGRVFRDPAQGGEPGPDMFRGECIQTLTRLDDGRVILGHGKNAHHFFQITGLETVKRFAGTVNLTPEQADLARQRQAAATSEAEARAPLRVAVRKDAVKVDGDLAEWDWAKAAAIGPREGAPRAEVALATDGKTLFAAFRVWKAGGFLNTGDDVTRLFLTGDAADLQVCLDPAADPQRPQPTMGDLRLLFSKLGDRPVAVVYQVQKPGAKSPVGFRSPVREVVFDEVVEAKGAQVSLTPTPEGYVVEAAVPFTALGLREWPGLWAGRVLPGDAGIIVADATGRRVARIYRFNQKTQLVADVPTEAALMPGEWGQWEVEQEKPRG